MLSLTAAETIRGVASAASAITYTLLGDEVSAGSDAFKVLAQGQLPSSIGTLYTVPASKMALVKSIHLANPTASDRTAQLNVNGTAGANVILPPATIVAGGFAIYDGRWTFYNAQGQALGVGATGAAGADGADGATGPAGADGTDGVGVPAGGTAGQRLAKIDGTDYNTEWVSPGAATVDVQEGGSSVVAAAGGLNFDAAHFNVTDEGGGVAGVALASPGGGSQKVLGLPTGTLDRTYTFDSTTESWTTAADGTLSAVGGRLRQVTSGAGGPIALEPSGAGNIANGEVEADFFHTHADSDVSIVFRATDASNAYMIRMDNYVGGVQLYKIVSGGFTSLGTGVNPLPSQAGTKYRALVRFDGSVISLYINGTLVGVWSDTTYTTGRTGFRVGSNGKTVEVDNWKVYSGVSL